MQRSNEELLSQAEGYQVQIEHLSSRLRAVQPSQTEVLMANFGTRRHGLGGRNNAMEAVAATSSAAAAAGIGVESPIDDLDTSEESLPIFDEDDDDEDDGELDFSHEIETDV